MSDPVDAQRRVWTIGDYPVIARQLLPISIDAVAAAGVSSGDRVLDVAVGNGNAAIEAARRGASVTGIDLTPAQIDRARERCAREGVDVELRVGDAEALDVPDGAFDVVLSVMGVIFAPDHVRAASEMARACRPGGRIALTAWAVGGWSVEWRRRIAAVLPPSGPGSPAPDQWGTTAEVVRRLGAAGLEATVVERPFAFQFDSVEHGVSTFLTAAGPYVQMLETATALGVAEEAVAILRDTMAETNAATDGTCALPAPYLLATARR